MSEGWQHEAWADDFWWSGKTTRRRFVGLSLAAAGALGASLFVPPPWRAAFGQDFMSRKDGYPGLARAYGLRFAAPPSEMDLSLTYRALAAGQVDLIAGNSTDGLIDKLGLYQLEDDRHYFPPYQAAPLVRSEALSRYPGIQTALSSLAGKLTDAQMRRLNYAVDGEHRTARDVVKEFLAGLPAQGP